MNILIVDDQSYVVQGIRAGVRWEHLPADHIYEACSSGQAIEIMKNNTVDIVVTDIEMPYISGLDLAEWIASNRPDTAVIFLTAHADFSYAQQAIKIGCYDYIVQPVDYGRLEECIWNVMQKVIEQRNLKDVYAQGMKWKTMKKELQENFWRKIVLSRGKLPFLRIEQESRNVELTLNWEDRYRLVLINVLSQVESLSHWRGNDPNQELELLMRERIDGRLPVVCHLMMDEVTTLYIMKDSPLIEDMEAFVRTAKDKCQCGLACYLSAAAGISELYLCMEEIDALREKNVGPYNGVFQKNEGGEKPAAVKIPPSGYWMAYLAAHEEEKVSGEVDDLIAGAETGGTMDEKFLIALAQSLLHAYYMRLKSIGIDENSVEQTELLDALKECARSIKNMHYFVQVLLEKNKEISWKKSADAEDTVRRIKEYIDANLDHELSRQEIADHVFMSKDYISHLFKRQENIGLVDYMNNRKIEQAKNLLRNTNIPVTLIAKKVGVPNYSYFCKMFKRQVGMSASEYRDSTPDSGNV